MSSAMNEFFGRHPQRPDHPDFWKISEIILQLDGAIDAAVSDDEKERIWKERTSAVVDIPSVTYMAIQRALRVLGRPSNAADVGRHSSVAALAIDSFIAGVLFAQRGGHQND